MGSNPTPSAMAIKQFIIPAATITVECEEGTDISQLLTDLLYVGCEADDLKTKFRVLDLNPHNIYPITLTE